MYSTGSNWHISHTLLSKGELLLSGAGAVFAGWLVLPTKLPDREAALQAPAAACGFTLMNQAL